MERVVLETLGVPRQPWTPGAAVPFEEEQAAVLERLRSGEDAAARMTLESLLAR